MDAAAKERFGPSEVQAFLDRAFSPWVQDLGLRAASVEADGATFILPANRRFARGRGEGPLPVSGQAIAAAADTCSVLTLYAMAGRRRDCTTVDLTVHFMRPLPSEDAEFKVTVLSNGRRLATTRVEARTGGGGKLAATATCAFAWLED